MNDVILSREFIGLPKTANGAHGHWTTAAAERKRWKIAVRDAFSQIRPLRPFSRATLQCIRYSSGEIDYDNLVGSFKGCRDGLKEARVIVDDGPKVIIDQKYHHEVVPPKEGKIQITVIGHEMISEEAYDGLVRKEVERQLKKKLARMGSQKSAPRKPRKPA